jgi:hypothetical protein
MSSMEMGEIPESVDEIPACHLGQILVCPLKLSVLNEGCEYLVPEDYRMAAINPEFC